MPLSPERVRELEADEEELMGLIESSVGDDDYEAVSSELSNISSVLNQHYNAYRQLDANGKLKATPKATRLPASSSDDPKAKETSYFFEPSVAEVREMYRKDPELIKKLGLSTKWQTGISVPQTSMPIMDASGHAPAGWNIQPAKTFIDTLSDTEEPYTELANYLWEQRLADARQRGEVVKRYRDIHLAPGQLKDLVKGGAEYVATRQVAPAAMGAAKGYSMGQAAPLYDAARDMYDYNQSRAEGRTIPPEHQVVTDPMTGMPMGTNETQPAPYDSRDLPPSSRELELRSPLADMAGGIAAYGLPGNPANLAEKGLSTAMGYAKSGVGGRLMNSAISGAGANVLESAVGQASRQLGEHQPPGDWFSDIPSAVGEAAGSYDIEQAAVDTAFGAGGGLLGDIISQSAGGMRNAYRESRRDLQPVINAGGDTAMWGGVDAPPQVEADLKEASKVRAVGSPGAIAADRLAPRIQKSLLDQQKKEKDLIAKQSEEYFSHPVYGQIRTSARPLVESLINLAQQGRVNSPLSGGRVAFNRDNIRKIREEFGSNWAEITQVPREQAGEFVAAHDGVVIDNGLALELFDADVPPNMVPVIVVDPMSAREVTAAEDWINDRLRHAKVQGGNNDPVYMAMDAGAKQMRDKFPLWRDEAGNLVNPPPETRSSQPYSPSGDIPPPADPSQAVSVIPKPREVGETRPRPEAKPGVGPGRPRMFGPFDMRAAQQGGERASIMPRPRDIVDRPRMVYEATPGAGPGQPDLPNPFDARLGNRRIPVRGDQTVSVTGGEYGPPPPLDPNARLGVGDRFNPEPVVSFTDEGLPVPANVSAQPTVGVRGDYNRPPEVQMERAPTTERNPYGFTQRGQPEPEVPLPPSERNPFATSPVAEESLSTLAGNKLAMKAEEPKPVPDEVEPIRGETLEQFQARGGKTGAPLPPEIQAKVDDGTLTSEAQQKTVNEEIRQQTEAPTGKRYAILDQQDGAVREKTFATAAEAKAEAKRLGEKFKSKGRFKVKGVDGPAPAAPDERGGLERMLDARLEKAPKADQAEIDEIGALQTADREQVARDQKQYVEGNLSPGREARAAESEKMASLAEHQEAIEQAMGQANDMAERFGATDSERRQWIADIVSKKLGRNVTVEDLIDAGLLAGGVGAAVIDEDGEAGSAAAAVGGGRLFGRKGKKKKKKEPEAPKETWPQEPKATLDNGDEVKGFSALRRQQHLAQGGIETAKQKVGALGDQSIRNRIIGFNRGDDIDYDKALLAEAQRIGAEDELWRAAASAGWLDVKGRARGGTKGEGVVARTYDFVGPRADALAGYLSGAGRNPVAAGPSDLSEHLWRIMLADPTRRLMDQSGGKFGARYGNDAATIYQLLFGEEQQQEEEQP